MPLSVLEFLSHMAHNPVLCFTVLLTSSVLLVNGWTDAPNAIAGVVATQALPFRQAVVLAAVCNFLGVLCVTAVNVSVAETIYSIASFGADHKAALTALCAAMAAVVIWAAAAWCLGIPTSESHALVAGISGAAAALEHSLNCIRWDCWGRVFWGLLMSIVVGFGGGFLVQRRLSLLSLPPAIIRCMQIPGAAVVSFFHGAQDGQKFLGVFLLGVALAEGRGDERTFLIPLWLVVLCAAGIALGTLMGGRRIINTVGCKMVQLTPLQGLSSDLGSIPTLLLATGLGLPISTTHTRTAALLGVGVAGYQRLNWAVAGRVGLAWLLTFPVCALLGYGLSMGFLTFLR